MFADFLEARKARFSPSTHRHYDRALRRFALWLAERHPKLERLTCELLTRDAAEAWFGSLLDPELSPVSVATANLYIAAIYSSWKWAHDSDTYESAVSRPRRFELPAPPGRPAVAPSWEQMDQVISAAYRRARLAPEHHQAAWIWRARLVTVLRFTGLRVDEQAMELRWEDFDLEAAELTIRGELGKSAREREGRVVPLSPHLVSLMAGWGQRQGYVIASLLRDRRSNPERMAELWRDAAIPERIWGRGSSGRRKSSVHHAFRRGFKTGLSRLGAPREVRDFLLGHHRGIDEHYLDTWEQAVLAVSQIPPLSEAASTEMADVVPLRGRP